MYRILKSLITKIPRLVFVSAAVFASFGLAVSPLASSTAAAACSSGCVASMSLSPSSGTYKPGDTVTVSIYVNTGGQSVNAVQSDFTYTSSRLQFQSINSSGSAFAIDASSTGGGGSVSIARGNITAVSGSSILVARVNFTVLSGNDGAVSLTLSSSSTVASSTTNQDILGSRSGASYTVATPAPAPTPPPPTGGGTTTPPPSTPKTTTTTPTTSTPTPTTTTTTPTATPTPTQSDKPVDSPRTTTDTPLNSGTVTSGEGDESTNEGISPLAIGAIALGVLALFGAAGLAARQMIKRRQSASMAHMNVVDGVVAGTAEPVPYSPQNSGENAFGSFGSHTPSATPEVSQAQQSPQFPQSPQPPISSPNEPNQPFERRF